MEHLNNSCQAGEVILGVDTHLDVHVGVVIDAVGRLQGTLAVATNPAGYEQLLRWAQGLGVLHRAGVEGTGSYGAGLTRFLEDSGIEVVEVNRPDRARRRSRGKSDPTDAESAARAVLAGEAKGQPKTHSGLAEALRIVSVARRSAVKARTQAINQAAPPPLEKASRRATKPSHASTARAMGRRGRTARRKRCWTDMAVGVGWGWPTL